jgi:hypothetical protein
VIIYKVCQSDVLPNGGYDGFTKFKYYISEKLADEDFCKRKKECSAPVVIQKIITED